MTMEDTVISLTVVVEKFGRIHSRRVHNVLINQRCHLPRHISKVDRVSVTIRSDLELLLPLVGHKLLPQLLRISVHEEIELGQDGEPDVVGADYQGLVVVIALGYGVHESTAVRDDVLAIAECPLIKG